MKMKRQFEKKKTLKTTPQHTYTTPHSLLPQHFFPSILASLISYHHYYNLKNSHP